MVKARTKITLMVLAGSLASTGGYVVADSARVQINRRRLKSGSPDGCDTWPYRHHSDRLRIPFRLRPISCAKPGLTLPIIVRYAMPIMAMAKLPSVAMCIRRRRIYAPRTRKPCRMANCSTSFVMGFDSPPVV
jgi:hypothetical protein